MNGIEYRLREFIHPVDGRSLVVDTSAGMALGALPGLEDYESTVRAALPAADGLVCSPGQLRRLQRRSMHEAGLLMRMDWTNTLRGEDFVISPTETKNARLFSAQDALDFGAVGMVISFLLGYEEEIEAQCMHSTVTLALEGKPLGMPLVVEVRPTGPRVSLYGKAVELGASYAQEGGADVIVIPDPGKASLDTIAALVHLPWLMKVSPGKAPAELNEVVSRGGAGIWLDHELFAQDSPAGTLSNLHQSLHQIQKVG
jgi:DhnA family fructose-bisphosphate aldolase class Ia